MILRWLSGMRTGVLAGFIFTALMLLPIAWLTLSAFRPAGDIVERPFGRPQNLSLASFRALFGLPHFGASLCNSLMAAAATASVSTSLGLLVGYLLERFRFRGRGVLRAMAFGGYLLAPAALAVPYFQLFRALGLVDTLTGIVIGHIIFCFPLSIGIGETIVRSVPPALEEVAMLDGCGLLRRVYRVVLPAALPQVLALILLTFTVSWKEFFFAFLLSNSPGTRTLPVLLANLQGGEAINWPLMCALAVVLLAPLGLFLLAFPLVRGTRGEPVTLGLPGLRS